MSTALGVQVRRAARAALVLVCAATWGFPAAAASEQIEIWLLTSRPDGAVARGARMGADEMRRTASLLGRGFVLRELHTESARGAEHAVSALKQTRNPAVVVVDLDEAPACEIARALHSVARGARGRLAIINPRVASKDCGGWLQIRLPRSARQRLIERAGARDARLDEWHPSLTRFGAGELNERYERRTRQRMDGDAWAGWFAVKAGTEAILRAGAASRAALTGASAPAIDGHKGVPLRFTTHGVLQQPMYLIEEQNGGPAVVREVPCCG